MPPTVDVVVTTTVRRGASLAARAAKYDVLLGLGLHPADINEIPTEIFNEMALGCEPAPGPVDEVVFTPGGDFTAKYREALRREIRRNGAADLAAVLA